jgi:hypothetical protein
MEPFEHDELSDGELDELLRKWESPVAPARLRAAVFPGAATSRWRRLWHASIRIPVPAGLAMALAIAMVVALAIGRRPAQATGLVTKIERVEVPVIQERVITRIVYRDRVAAQQMGVATQQMDVQKLRPVAELRPVIIRRENVQN